MNQTLTAHKPLHSLGGTLPGAPALAGLGLLAHPETAIRVLIADDHPFVRSGIKQCINDSPGMRVVGEAGTALEVFAYLGSSSCDVLVLDIGLPDQSGLEVLRILKKSHPALPVLILTMYPEDQFSQFCMRAGAAGFLSKSNASNHLVDAIREVADRGRGAPPANPGSAAPPAIPPHQALSGREFQIFCQIASGKSRKEISTELRLSLKTVNASRAGILEQMGMTCDADIVRYVNANHLSS